MPRKLAVVLITAEPHLKSSPALQRLRQEAQRSVAAAQTRAAPPPAVARRNVGVSARAHASARVPVAPAPAQKPSYNSTTQQLSVQKQRGRSLGRVTAGCQSSAQRAHQRSTPSDTGTSCSSRAVPPAAAVSLAATFATCRSGRCKGKPGLEAQSLAHCARAAQPCAELSRLQRTSLAWACAATGRTLGGVPGHPAQRQLFGQTSHALAAAAALMTAGHAARARPGTSQVGTQRESA